MRFLFFLTLVVLGWSKGFAFSLSASLLLDRISRVRLVRREETVLFFPTASYQLQEGNGSIQWVVPVHGWIFDTERRGLRRRAFLSLLRTALNHRRDQQINSIDDEQDDDEEQILRQVKSNDTATKELLARRVLPFIVDNHRRRQITIQFGDQNIVRELPERSRKNGHFNAILRFTEDELLAITDDKNGGKKIRYKAMTGIDNDSRCFEGESLLVPATGLSVISDIDDTVKISDVLDKKRLIRHTFLEEFEAVPGMADLYRSWKEEHNASFHFVSSSPWQLYEEIASFFAREGFPEASFHLKSIRLKDRTLLDLFSDPMASKTAKISSIIETFPERKFVLVGDTGERDAEVYGEICRRYPAKVLRVLLRDVTSHLSQEVVLALNKKEEKKGSGVVVNGPDRFSNAFAGVPANKWTLFTDASTISL